jgi:5-methyltetrahydrofolate--homocysteine methyltransferase
MQARPLAMQLRGSGSALEIAPGDPVQIIGERINPSGKPALRRALLAGDLALLIDEARRQVAAGADVIDVNVGGKGIDEAITLPKAVAAVAGAVDAPLCIDTRAPAALKAALALCPGRPLINSISAEKKALNEILPIVAAHGLPVIALCMGQEGIPGTVDGRLRCAEQALEAAVQAGIAEGDVVLDPLVMTVGADDQAARLALETVRRLREAFPANNITGGTSNVSFGMPARPVLNTHFCAVAVYLGMNLPITDPTDTNLRFALSSATILLGRDKRTRNYMRLYRATRSAGVEG